MALRKIVLEGDEILTKKCRKIEDINSRITMVLDDMKETMEAENGVGIAAPQVGILKRMCIIKPEEDQVIELINPEIILKEGEQEDYEGCLSVPGYVGLVKRPARVMIRCLNREGGQENYDLTGFGAVVACHEIDHLDGVVYTAKAKDIHKPSEKDPEE